MYWCVRNCRCTVFRLPTGPTQHTPPGARWLVGVYNTHLRLCGGLHTTARWSVGLNNNEFHRWLVGYIVVGAGVGGYIAGARWLVGVHNTHLRLCGGLHTTARWSVGLNNNNVFHRHGGVSG